MKDIKTEVNVNECYLPCTEAEIVDGWRKELQYQEGRATVNNTEDEYERE